jgi:hypothetical protein
MALPKKLAALPKKLAFLPKKEVSLSKCLAFVGRAITSDVIALDRCLHDCRFFLRENDQICCCATCSKYNIINIVQQLSFIAIMIYIHHVFVINTGYERWSLLGEIPRFSSNKVNNKRHSPFYLLRTF